MQYIQEKYAFLNFEFTLYIVYYTFKWKQLLSKNAISVSWYPYNWSQIVQYVKYTKWTYNAKRIAGRQGRNYVF